MRVNVRHGRIGTQDRVLNVTGASLVLAGTAAQEPLFGYVGLGVLVVNAFIWYRARRRER
jgi:hypothetical protein